MRALAAFSSCPCRYRLVTDVGHRKRQAAFLKSAALCSAFCLLFDSGADRNKDRLPLISVAAIDGAAIGGGGELSTACDFRVAGPECNIRFVQVKV